MAYPALFDPEWYRAYSQRIGGDDTVLYEEYATQGWRQGASPHPLFSVDYYLRRNGDVRDADVEPLRHFIDHGWRERRDPHPLFDVQWYLARNADVAKMQVNPVEHYVVFGWKERRTPHPLFDSEWYLARNPDVEQEQIDPLIHFISKGWREGRNPHPYFDIKWYFEQAPEGLNVEINPLEHYLTQGWREGISPHPLFDASWYLQCNPDVKQNDVNPLLHYISSGESEGRHPHPLFSKLMQKLGFVSPYQTSFVRFAFERCAYPSNLIDALWVATSEGLAPRDAPHEILRFPSTLTGKRVCLFAAYARRGKISAATWHLVEALLELDLAVILVVATDTRGRVEIDTSRFAAVIVRDNCGFDFASWALALTVFPGIWDAKAVLIANDSIYGPLHSERFKAIWHRMVSRAEDCVALTENYETRRHLQTYFLLFNGACLRNPQFRSFWSEIRVTANQMAIVAQYEIGLAPILEHASLTAGVLFPIAEYAGVPINPTIVGWRQLIAEGYPFLKRRLLQGKIKEADIAQWRQIVSGSTMLPLIDAEIAEELAAFSCRLQSAE